MSDDDRDSDAPSLEPPSLFRRRRREKTPPPVEEPEPTEVLEPVEAEPVTVPDPIAAAEPAEAPPLYVDEVEPTPVPAPVPEPAPAPVAERKPREPRAPRGPVLTGIAAAVATGVLVGLLVVALTAGGLRGCEAARGTSTCGGAGYPLLLAIFVIAVLAGSALLRWSQVPDPGSTSFLAIGLVTVVALLFLIDALDSGWMLLVIPAVSTAAYAASYAVTTAVIEPARE